MNKALGISQVSVEKDLAPGLGDLFRATIVNVGRCHEADSRVSVVDIVVVEETAGCFRNQVLVARQ